MQEESRKPLRVKLGYGTGDLSSSIFFTVGTFLLLNFLTDTVGLNAALAGVALMIGKVWDAVTDPEVGHIYGVISAYIIMFFAGIGFSTHYILPWSIVPDTVDYDYAKTGIQREGIYYGLWSFVVKFGAAPWRVFSAVWCRATRVT